MSGDGDFSAWASARWPSLIRSAVFLGCRPDEAQDLVQTTLMRCYAKWSKVVRAGDRDAYAFRVLLNCLRDSRRRRWWGEHPTDDLPEPYPPSGEGGNAFDDIDTADAVRRALANLTPAHRDVVVLRHMNHLSEQQTAHALEISPGTVKSRLSRALDQLSRDPHLLALNKDVTP